MKNVRAVVEKNINIVVGKTDSKLYHYIDLCGEPYHK